MTGSLTENNAAYRRLLGEVDQLRPELQMIMTHTFPGSRLHHIHKVAAGNGIDVLDPLWRSGKMLQSG